MCSICQKEHRAVVFWSAFADAERLCCESVDEAVEEYLDECFSEEVPQTLTVYGYARVDVTVEKEHLSERALDEVLDGLDGTYGDPHGDFATATPSMRRASEVFIDAVLAEYESWACEKVCQTEVNIAAWRTAPCTGE